MFTFGKYNGRTFSSVFEAEKGYVAWTLKQESPSGALANFKEFCLAQQSSGSTTPDALRSAPPPAVRSVPSELSPVSGGSSPGPRPAASAQAWQGRQQLTFGKYKDKTFEEALAADPGYARWAISRESPTGNLADFQEFCRKRLADSPPAAPQAAGQPRQASPGQTSPPSGAAAAGAAGPLGGEKRPASGSSGGPSKLQRRDSDGSPTVEPARRLSFQAAQEAQGHSEERECEMCGDLFDPPHERALRCRDCWKEHLDIRTEPFYLEVPMHEKDDAKRRGAWWDRQRKRWYVPAGKDVSLCAKWYRRCSRCSEPIGNPDAARQCQPQCPAELRAAEAAKEAEELARLEALRAEQEELARAESERRAEDRRQEQARLAAERAAEAERHRQRLLKRKRDRFVKFLEEEAATVDLMLLDKISEGSDSDDSGSHILQDLRPAGGLRQHLVDAIALLSAGEPAYNPFGDDLAAMREEVTRWFDTFGGKSWRAHVKFDYSPMAVLSFAATLTEEPQFHTERVERIVAHLLRESLDPITPDLKRLIIQRLQDSYEGTTCFDVVGIFAKVACRVREQKGAEEFRALSKQRKADWMVLEYMSNRRSYFSKSESEETTKRRDLVSKTLQLGEDEGFITKILNEEETDAVYHNACGEGSTFALLRWPNTHAVDLFSHSIVVEEAAKIQHGGRACAPSPATQRRRSLDVFRTLHFRISRKLGGCVPRYGVDEGLREADVNVHLKKMKQDFGEYHEEMLRHQWPVASWVGWQQKMTHQNSQLVAKLLQHLGLDEGTAKQLEDRAAAQVHQAWSEVAERNDQLRQQLLAQSE